MIAGTKDARALLKELANLNLKLLATVTTGYGNALLKDLPGISVVEGMLDTSGMVRLILLHRIRCVIDASHPFAREASINAMGACQKTDTLYIRFERSSIHFQGEEILKVKTFEEAAETAKKIEGNIFLTIGSNFLHVFAAQIETGRLYVRVLPDSRMIARCEEAGLGAGNILALKGPFSEKMNIEMMRHCQAAVMVTKESGEVGGTIEKLNAARKLGIPVILIERPQIHYPEVVYTVDEAVRYINQKILR